MSTNVELHSGAFMTADDEKKRRYRDFCEYQRGKRDGQEGLALGGISEVYIEGYILGRKLAFRILRKP